MRHPAALRNPLDDAWQRRFLEDDDVGSAEGDDGLQRVLSSGPAAADIVAEELDRHSWWRRCRGAVVSSPRSISVRYGWPSSSPRKYMTASRVAWMFTGRWTIAMSCSRSGTSSGAIVGSSSLNGREWMPGTKNPVILKNSRTFSPTRV